MNKELTFHTLCLILWLTISVQFMACNSTLSAGYRPVKPAKNELYTKYEIQLLRSDSIAISLSDGQVSRVVNILGDVHVFVAKDTLEYVYSQLTHSLVTSGDSIRKGQKLGVLLKNAASRRYELTFRILQGIRVLHHSEIVRNLNGL